MTNEDILKALSNVQEPDLGKDLVTLNMVKDITIDGNNVSFTSCAYHACLPYEGYDHECLHQCSKIIGE